MEQMKFRCRKFSEVKGFKKVNRSKQNRVSKNEEEDRVFFGLHQRVGILRFNFI